LGSISDRVAVGYDRHDTGHRRQSPFGSVHFNRSAKLITVNAHFMSMTWNEMTSSMEASRMRHYLLARAVTSEHVVGMAELAQKEMAIPPVAERAPMSKAKLITIKIIALTALTLALGFTQGWASSRLYKPDHVAGFQMGLLHGMLMPAALPGLLMGQDLPIYAPNNSGRSYNIGYILGINTCGTLFFGIAFFQPQRRHRLIVEALKR
jgi:hypothetical protein